MRKSEFFALVATVLVATYSFISYQNKQQLQFTVSHDWPIIPKKISTPPDFSAIRDVDTKKQTFFDYLRPGIAWENKRILEERVQLEHVRERFQNMTLNTKNMRFIKEIAARYNVKLVEEGVDNVLFDRLLKRVNIIPEGLVLVQAANESAWGTSRFAKQGNNFFGQWCYSSGCGLVPMQRSDGKSHEVAKFKSVQQSIHRYFMNVNRNRAYEDLREIRRQRQKQGKELHSVNAAMALADGLLKYSERGDDYVNDLKAMIRHNEHFWQHEQE